jgi:hypothetical protein
MNGKLNDTGIYKLTKEGIAGTRNQLVVSIGLSHHIERDIGSDAVNYTTKTG